MISYNGINWTGVASSNEFNLWQCVTWSPGLGMFVAVADTGGNKVMTLDCKTPLKITGDSQVVGRFTASSIQAGEGAPITKTKKLTGTTASTQGGAVSVTHGLDATKILAIYIKIEYSPAQYVPVPYSAGADPGFEGYYSISPGVINLTNRSGNSASILSKPFTVLITYEE